MSDRPHAHFAQQDPPPSSVRTGRSESTSSQSGSARNPADIAQDERDRAAQGAIPFSRPGTPVVAHERMAFVGLGNMGREMAMNLARWGGRNGMPPLVVWNRSSDRTDAFTKAAEEEGIEVEVAKDLEYIGETCDIILTSLGSDAAVKEVYEQLFTGQERKKGKGSGILPDGDTGRSTIFVDTSTVYPSTSGELETRSSTDPHRHFLTCPVFGPPPLARQASLILAISGSYWAKKHVSHLLVPSIGKRVLDLGSNVERAMSFKLVGNSMVLGIIELLAETTTLADQSGVGAEQLYALFEAFFPAPSILGYSRKMIDNNFKGENGFTLQGGIKDASHIRRLAEESSVPMPIIDIAHQHLIAARANGGDQLDWSSLVGGQRISAGLPPFTKKTQLVQYDD